jgi:hypothetical protein
MGCSWALYIGRGRLAEEAEERSRWRPVEFNIAAVSSLEYAPRGEGKWRGGAIMKGEVEAAWPGTRRRRSARWQLAERVVAVRHRTGGGRQRRSGPSGVQRSVGPDDRVGRLQKWKMKRKMELGWATRYVWAEFKLGR